MVGPTRSIMHDTKKVHGCPPNLCVLWTRKPGGGRGRRDVAMGLYDIKTLTLCDLFGQSSRER